MRNFAWCCLALLAWAFIPSARADEDQGSKPYLVEVSGGTTAALAIFTSSPTQTTFTIESSVAVPLDYPSLDFALDALFTTSDTTGVRISDFSLVPGIQYNLLDSNPRNSFFLFIGAGFSLASAAYESDTHFTFRVRGGKRFALTSSVSYAPFVSYTKTSTLDGEVDLVPLAFSLFF